jgi:hypothetical protein
MDEAGGNGRHPIPACHFQHTVLIIQPKCILLVSPLDDERPAFMRPSHHHNFLVIIPIQPDFRLKQTEGGMLLAAGWS